MSSISSTIQPFELTSSDQFEAAFDYYADRFTPKTSDQIISYLSKLDSLNRGNNTSHLTHRLVSLVYTRLVELIEKAITIDYSLSDDEIIVLENCFHFIMNIIQSADKSTKHELYEKIFLLNDSFLKFIQYDGWKAMENHEEIMEQAVKFLTKHDHSDDDSSIENDRKLFDVFVQCLTSSDGIKDFLNAIKKLDSLPRNLTKHDQFLLFDCFSYIVQSHFYTIEFRKQFCHIWLPYYANILKEFISKSEVEYAEKNDQCRLPLNTIKYLVTNLILMQRTENTKGIFCLQGRITNPTLRDEYGMIIDILLPLLTNRHILRGFYQSQTNEHLGLHHNTNKTTTNVSVTFVIWIILKLILMFINANGDCLIYMRDNKKVKEKLFKLIKSIDKNNVLIVSVYNILALLVDEQDTKNEASTVKGMVSLLLNSIRSINEDDHHRDVKLIELLVTLKTLLQCNQLKIEFQADNGLPLLMKLAMIKSRTDLDVSDKSERHEIIEQLKGDERTRQEFRNAAEEIQRLALECFFTVSFNEQAAECLKTDEQFMKHIRDIVDGNKTSNTALKKAADGLLWKLEKEEQFKKQQQTDPTNKDKNEFDMMISYSWDDKLLAHRIYKYLTEQYSYRIWLDENEMSGSLFQAMAQAIEKSKIILICMSEKYKQSDNCRSEAEYAHMRKKIIIPLKMKKVELDGWLGFIIAGKLYIDFAHHDFEKSIDLLKSEIEKKQITSKLFALASRAVKGSMFDTAANPSHVDVPPTPFTPKSPVRPNVISKDYQKIAMELWSEEHVQHFLFDKKLDLMVLLTENMNGEELQELFRKCQPQQEYWLMFERLSKELREFHQKTLPISVYIRFIMQTAKYSHVSSF